MKQTYRDEIRSIAMERGVQLLFHFTQAANLSGIIKYGIRSRRELAEAGYPAYASDRWRLDDSDDAVSVSVSRTSHAMFASKRDRSGHRDWVVLVLPAQILWTHSCTFCWCNAALNEIKRHGGWRGGPWAFRKMFEGSVEARRNLPLSYPTDLGAEVQVMERIAPEYILGAVVDRKEMRTPVQAILSNLEGHRPVVVADAG